MANYEVTLAYRIAQDPPSEEDCPHVGYWSVSDVPDELVGEDCLKYMEEKILHLGRGNVVRVKDLRVMRRS